MMRALVTVGDGVHLGALAPGQLLNTVVLDGADGAVVVDAGFRWSARRISRLLRGREVVEHLATHAHGDHVGSSAWLCRTTGASLAMSSVEADEFERGNLATHGGVAARAAIPLLGGPRCAVDRRLASGDEVAGFMVIVQPGHSPGTVALWREADRTLIVGDGPVNLSRDPAAPRWLGLPRGLHHDARDAYEARLALTRLNPALVVSTHGYPVAGAARWAAGVRPYRPARWAVAARIRAARSIV